MKYRCTNCKRTFSTIEEVDEHFQEKNHEWGGFEHIQNSSRGTRKMGINRLKSLKNNKTILWLGIAFIIANILDIVSTLNIICFEANPLWIATNGNLSIMLSLKILVAISPLLLYKFAKIKTKATYFFFITLFTIGTAIILFASINNFIVGSQQECDTTTVYRNNTVIVGNGTTNTIVNNTTVDTPSRELNIDDGVKTARIKYYLTLTLIFYLYPIIVSMITFWLYDRSKHKAEITELSRDDDNES